MENQIPQQENLPKPELDLPANAGTSLQGDALQNNGKKLPFLKILIVLLLIIILISGFIGAYFLGKNNANQTSITPGISQSPTPTTIPTPAEDQKTANWKTYNSSCGFSVKYPPTWQANKFFILDSKKACANLENEEFKVYPQSDVVDGFWINITRKKLGTIEQNTTINSLDSYIESHEKIVNPKGNVPNKATKNYGQYPGIEFDTLGFGGYREFIFIKDEYVYSIKWRKSSADPYQNEIKNVISSIKFTQ